MNCGCRWIGNLEGSLARCKPHRLEFEAERDKRKREKGHWSDSLSEEQKIKFTNDWAFHPEQPMHHELNQAGGVLVVAFILTAIFLPGDEDDDD